VTSGSARYTRQCWWDQTQTQMSAWYQQWDLPYQTTKTQIELTLPHPVLAYLLAIWTRHGDFAWYHINFRHNTAGLNCSCGRLKTPEHMLFCKKTRRSFSRWLLRPFSPPSNMEEAVRYLEALFTEPEHFETLLELTKYFTLICRG
jgi:hypothetical protein